MESLLATEQVLTTEADKEDTGVAISETLETTPEIEYEPATGRLVDKYHEFQQKIGSKVYKRVQNSAGIVKIYKLGR
jgi:hypothetical protein